MTTPRASTDTRWRLLLWTAAACIAVAWIAEIVAASIGPAPAWPNWLVLVAVTGSLASNGVRSVRLRVSLGVTMAILSVVAVVGMSGAKP